MRDFHIPGRSMVYASTGMVATSHPMAAGVGVDILRRGGTAVDAAVAAALVLNVCEPHMTGLGGDCFALVQPAAGAEILGLNGSGRAPAGMDAAALRAAGHRKIPGGTGHAVTVPGAVDGLLTMLDRFGKLGRDAVLAPAIHYAEKGVPVAPRVASDWALAAENLRGAARDLYLDGGRPLRVGQIFRAPKQAEVLRRIVRDGRAGFYEGPVAEAMVAALQAAGGTHTLEDFADNKPDEMTPIRGALGSAELVELPPNGQGATALLIANILSHFDLAALDPLGATRAHLEAEATKLAYDARNRFIGDARTSVTYLDHMLAPETGLALADLIDLSHAMDGPAALSEAVHKDTVYLTVVDRDGMVVSLIYSLFSDFGSGIVAPETGIIFQDRGTGFNLTPGHPNEAAPGKRPMHTIIPAMLMKGGDLAMPFGVMGGQYQACGHNRFVGNMEVYGMDAQAAIDAPRCFAIDGVLRVERGYSDAVRQELADLGHRVVEPDTAIGGAQAIVIDTETGVLAGASDPRKDGCALGY